jgi:dnd system-associated protein 4
MKKKPDRLYVDKDDLKDFKLLQDEKDSPFYKRENKDVFIMATIMGLKYGARMPVKSKEGFFREEYLNNDERSIIKAIAISEEKDVSVLNDMEKVYQIAEEFAKAGIRYLRDSVFAKEHGSYLKRLESELLEDFEKYKIEDSRELKK